MAHALPAAAPATLASVCSGLASLGMPSVTDSLELWRHVAAVPLQTWQRHPDAAATVLSSAAIFCLSRPPESLTAASLLPVLGSLAELQETNNRSHASAGNHNFDDLVAEIAFFLWTPLAEEIAGGSALHEDKVAGLRAHAVSLLNAGYGGYPISSPHTTAGRNSALMSSVSSFFIGCEDLHGAVEEDVVAGPLRVPFAVDIVSLVGGLRSLPLFDDEDAAEFEGPARTTKVEVSEDGSPKLPMRRDFMVDTFEIPEADAAESDSVPPQQTSAASPSSGSSGDGGQGTSQSQGQQRHSANNRVSSSCASTSGGRKSARLMRKAHAISLEQDVIFLKTNYFYF